MTRAKKTNEHYGFKVGDKVVASDGSYGYIGKVIQVNKNTLSMRPLEDHHNCKKSDCIKAPFSFFTHYPSNRNAVTYCDKYRSGMWIVISQDGIELARVVQASKAARIVELYNTTYDSFDEIIDLVQDEFDIDEDIKKDENDFSKVTNPDGLPEFSF